jgi:hypothetical protein
MAESARVLATEAMHEARAALAEFAETVERTLSGVDADIYRMDDWLRRDRPRHWKRQIQARDTAVQAAKALVSRKIILAAPDPARAIEEREMLKKAQRRLAEAQRRQEASRRWAIVWEKQAMEYKGGARDLRDMATVQIPAVLGRISRMMESLEGYLSIEPPKGASDRSLASDDPGTPPPEGPAREGGGDDHGSAGDRT